MKEVQRASGKTPEALKNKPDLPRILIDYYNAYFRLHARRQYMMGSELPLMVREIERFAVIHGFSGDMTFFYRVIEECEEEYFKILSERKKTEKANKPTAPPPRQSKPRRRR